MEVSRGMDKGWLRPYCIDERSEAGWVGDLGADGSHLPPPSLDRRAGSSFRNDVPTRYSASIRIDDSVLQGACVKTNLPAAVGS